MPTMLLTVAICTWNRESALRETLAHFASSMQQPDGQWELLLVDNGSSDRTRDVAAAFEGQLPLRYVFEAKAGLSNARNRAMEEARTPLLLFTDDDVRPEVEWIRASVEVVARWPRVALLGGPVEPLFREEPDQALVAAFPAVLRGYCGIDHGGEERLLDQGEEVYGANFAVRRDRVGDLRFDPSKGNCGVAQTGGEETDFQRRVRDLGRGDIVWAPSMRVHHVVYPERLQLSYLRRFTIDRAASAGGHLGIDGSAPTLLGAPRWLLRRISEEYLLSSIYAATGRRRQRFVHLAEAWRLRGVLAAMLASRPGRPQRHPRSKIQSRGTD